MAAKRILTILIVVGVGALIALAGSHTDLLLGDSTVPIFAVAVAVAFLVQWVVFVPSALMKTEKAFDLVGSATFITVATFALFTSNTFDARPVVLWIMVAIWALRLGAFLALRVHGGPDRRFDKVKGDPLRFLISWTMQGLWIVVTSAAALAAITSGRATGIDGWLIVGALLWVVGFAIEVTADAQKRAFRKNPANKDTFISTGLWAWSRHPNYFGEILLWIGATVAAIPALAGWQWATLISPVFVTLLLVRVSGIPLLEKSADERWGSRADYRAYRDNTPVLLPRPPRKSAGT